jgi:hypothetical protein
VVSGAGEIAALPAAAEPAAETATGSALLAELAAERHARAAARGQGTGAAAMPPGVTTRTGACLMTLGAAGVGRVFLCARSSHISVRYSPPTLLLCREGPAARSGRS